MELKLKDEKIQNQIQNEQEQKKKLEEELRRKISSEQNLKNQVKKSRQVMYAVIGIVILSLLIWVFANNYNNPHETETTTTDSTTAPNTTDTVSMPADSSAYEMSSDTTKKNNSIFQRHRRKNSEQAFPGNLKAGFDTQRGSIPLIRNYSAFINNPSSRKWNLATNPLSDKLLLNYVNSIFWICTCTLNNFQQEFNYAFASVTAGY